MSGGSTLRCFVFGATFGAAALLLCALESYAQAPVTAVMSRPKVRDGNLVATISVSVQPGWRVFGPRMLKGEQTDPLSLTLEDAPRHELVSVEWPKDFPESSSETDYTHDFEIGVVISQKRGPAPQDALPGSTEAEEEGAALLEDGDVAQGTPIASVAPKTQLRMTWMSCNEVLQSERRKAACVPGEALFVVKLPEGSPPSPSPTPTAKSQEKRSGHQRSALKVAPKASPPVAIQDSTGAKN